MKKFISILLVMCLSLGVFTVAVSAEQTKLETFVDTVIGADSVHVDIPDELIAEIIGTDAIKIKDVELAVAYEINEDETIDYSYAAAAKISIFKCRIIVTPEDAILYIPTILCRVNLDKILGEGMVYDALTDLVEELNLGELSEFAQAIDYLKLVSSSKEDLNSLGKLDCETYVLDLEALVADLIESGKIELEEGVAPEDITEAELIELIRNSDAKEIFDALAAATIKVYFDDNAFVGLVITEADGDKIEIIFGTDIEISFNAGEELFKKPFTLFDISGLFPRIIAMF